ncbi:collagen alpha-1(XIV) chain [Biomphalaria glabrata]
MIIVCYQTAKLDIILFVSTRNVFLNFSKDFFLDFIIGEQNIKVGLLVYTPADEYLFHLNSYVKKKDLLEAIDSVSKRQALPTRSPHFLTRLRSMFTVENGDRKAVTNVVVIISLEASLINMTDFKRETDLAMKEGISIYIYNFRWFKSHQYFK